MENFNFEYDFSLLNAVEIQKDKITHQEIVSIVENMYTCAYPLEGFDIAEPFYYLIGFSSKSRFLCLALAYKNDKITFYQVKVANETEIRQDYCSQ